MLWSPGGGMWHRIQSILHATVTFVMVERVQKNVHCIPVQYRAKPHYYSALLHYFKPPLTPPILSFIMLKASAGFSVLFCFFMGTNAHLAGVQG